MPLPNETSPERAPCGTPAAYKRHLARGETPCTDCRVRNREDQKQRRDSIRDGTLNVRVPLHIFKRLWEFAPPEERYAMKPEVLHLLNRAEYNRPSHGNPVPDDS
jgi:hypothetical protein